MKLKIETVMWLGFALFALGVACGLALEDWAIFTFSKCHGAVHP